MLNLKSFLLFPLLICLALCAPAQRLKDAFPGKAFSELGVRYYYQHDSAPLLSPTMVPIRPMHEADVYFLRNTAHRFFYRASGGIRFSVYNKVHTSENNSYLTENDFHSERDKWASGYLHLAIGGNVLQKWLILRVGLEGRFSINLGATEQDNLKIKDAAGTLLYYYRQDIKQIGGSGAGAFLFTQASVPVLEKFRIGAEMAIGFMQYTGTIRQEVTNEHIRWFPDDKVKYSSNVFRQWEPELLPRLSLGYTF